MAHKELVYIKLITALWFRSVNVNSICSSAAGRRVSGKRCRSIIDTRLEVQTDQICVLVLLAESVIGRHF